MQQLEEKLSTLSTGTEAVAAVMGNWHNVLRAVHMASGKSSSTMFASFMSVTDAHSILASIPKPKGEEEQENVEQLPQTLVRIPVHQADEQREREAAEAAAAGE